jgi:ferrous iron transport protein A
MHDSPLLPLELVEAGFWAEVEEVTGEPVSVSRMAEIGVRAGSLLRVLRQGSPCLLQVDGSRLSIRREARMQILVRPLLATG